MKRLLVLFAALALAVPLLAYQGHRNDGSVLKPVRPPKALRPLREPKAIKPPKPLKAPKPPHASKPPKPPKF